MNKDELLEKLKTMRISPDAYCLDGGFPNESYVLSEAGQKWEVYYSERGMKSNCQAFDDEASACAYLLKQISE